METVDKLEKFNLHKSVFNNDIDTLKLQLKSGVYDINQKDIFGNTPLHLAVMLGFVECAKIITEHNADTSIKNNDGWTPLAEAVSYGNRTSIKQVLKRVKQQSRNSFDDRKPKLVETLNKFEDFQLKIKWEFHSWVPLISRFLPSDTCNISKKGSNIRMDTTLIEFTDMKWHRGDISFLFSGSAGSSIMVLDNKKKVYQKLRQNDLETELNDEIDFLMSSDIVSAQISTKTIEFVPAQSGWIFKEDKMELIGDMNCEVYNVQGMTLTTRKRREHLTEDDLQKNKAMVEAISNGSSIVEKCEVDRRESLPPPPACPFSWEEYIKASGMPCIGRSPKVVENKRTMKVNVCMNQNFPLTTDLILGVLNVVAPSKHFEKIKEFVSLKLPTGFPVKIEIPVLPTVVARVTFQDFKWKNDFPDDLFSIPSDYTISGNILHN
ncbi:ankyrin repeat domain-containing protein 13C isoform X2 [Hydra vulgaris]|uniref:ankyrin repeat domain-containing protein 13C isoform X2 n=1 Tax=Hydra vulgaris TaxID=6087 RepID=UPI001F5E923D|nr:ankyrin repeat domain-containing protein 13C isoform X2 [Hydra vulgaris]